MILFIYTLLTLLKDLKRLNVLSPTLSKVQLEGLHLTSTGKASRGGMWRGHPASGHSFHVMAHIWLFGMRRTFPLQLPSRCLRM